MRSDTLQALQGEHLLDAWDEARGQTDLERALTMLAWTLPGVQREELAALPLAARNLLLLRMRQLSFGPQLEGTGTCPHCAGVLEFTLPLTAVIANLEQRSGIDCVEWDEDGKRLRLRSANTADLLSSLQEPSAEAAEELVLTRCTSVDNAPAERQELAGLQGVRARFEQLNAAAELRCALTCPQCSRSSTLDLDITRFLWLEVCHAARQLLRDVHALASGYGWSEREIASMSPRRRAAYLEVLGV
jgi:hypothetical protein